MSENGLPADIKKALRSGACRRCAGTGRGINHVQIGQALRMRRRMKDISQATMAKRLGKSLGYISFIENGIRNWTPTLIQKYLKALGQ